MIGLDIGLWSGFKRKMEIAESFAQPIVIVRKVNINVPTFLEVVLTMNRCYAEQVHLLQLQTYSQQILGLKTPKLCWNRNGGSGPKGNHSKGWLPITE
jgi:hypothetical protein